MLMWVGIAIVVALVFFAGALIGYGYGLDDVRVRPPIWRRWR